MGTTGSALSVACADEQRVLHGTGYYATDLLWCIGFYCGGPRMKPLINTAHYRYCCHRESDRKSDPSRLI